MDPSMKIKHAALALIIASVIWIGVEIYRFYSLLKLEYFTRDKTMFWSLFIGSLDLLVPLSLICLAIALIQSPSLGSTSDPTLNPADRLDVNLANLSVGDWLLNFLISSIPLIGLVVMIFWATDARDPLKKNWAIASLIWGTLVTLLSIFLFWGFLETSRNLGFLKGI